MTVRIGILGAADIAPTAVIDPAESVEGVQVVAVAARDPKRAEEFAREHGIPRVLPDYQAVIDDPGVDVVYVPTPASLHGYWTKRAIAAGKAVLCEKPFAANSTEAREVAAAADSAGVLVMEAMHSEHHPLWRAAQIAIDSGDLGTLTEIEVDFSWPIPDKSDIRWNPELAGGALMDLGIYPVTLLEYLFGAISVVGAEATEENGVDATLTAQLLSGGGVPIKFRTSMEEGTEPVQRLIVRGDRGQVTLDGFVHPHNGGQLEVTVDGKTRVLPADEQSSYACMLEVLRRGVTEGADVVTDAAAATVTMQLVDDLYAAAGMEPRKPKP